jgi:hypothetical protein
LNNFRVRFEFHHVTSFGTQKVSKSNMKYSFLYFIFYITTYTMFWHDWIAEQIWLSQ